AAPPAAPPAGASPTDDAILLEEITEIEIVSKGEARERHLSRTRIVTAHGAEMYDAASIPYSKGVVLKEVRGSVTLPGGKRIEVKKNQMIDRADFESFELFSDSMERLITFPGVVPGAIVEHSYVREVSSLIDLTGGIYFQRPIPAESMTLTVRSPKGFPIRFGTRGAPLDHVEREEGATVVRTWSAKNVAPLRREDNMPPWADLVPLVRVAPLETQYDGHPLDASNWAGIARFDWDLQKDRVVPAPEVAALARELTAGLTTPEAKTRALFEFAQKEINYVAVEVGIGGWQPHPNADVLRHRYGDCKDKATLLIAMLRAVDLTGYMVSIRTRDAGLVDRDIPSLSFNHAIVAVPNDTGYLFLDPTDPDTAYGDLPWGDQGVSVLVVKEGGGLDLIETPLMAPDRNRRHRKVVAAVTPSGDLEGTYVVEAWGQRRRQLADLLRAGEREKADTLEDLVALLCPGAVMLGHEVTAPKKPDDPIRVTVQFQVPRFVSQAGAMTIVSPHLARLGWLSRVAAYPTRRHPVLFPFLFKETSEVRLTLPAGMTLRKVPAPKDLAGAGLEAETRYETVKEGDRDVLVLRRTVTVGRREIPADDYAALRGFLSALGEEEASAVTLVPRS
ncbi:MAG TPA: DUF3857 domain-containing transglutaminase family protein, partial [Candidatus Polarisedimenticolia bacterium]|nr:DUF3857 domain-containing transglutaminase family protein [Candidatus Polarisedimenticolia bacterium]